MRRLVLIALLGMLLCAAAPSVAAQSTGGYYADGYYYNTGSSVPPQSSPYWPTNTETAYDAGVYAYAPGFGPYLRLGGEGGWNPNLGSTFNAYPPGNYYTDYGAPYLAVPAAPYGLPYGLRTYRGYPVSFGPAWAPAYGYPYGPFGP